MTVTLARQYIYIYCREALSISVSHTTIMHGDRALEHFDPSERLDASGQGLSIYLRFAVEYHSSRWTEAECVTLCPCSHTNNMLLRSHKQEFAKYMYSALHSFLLLLQIISICNILHIAATHRRQWNVTSTAWNALRLTTVGRETLQTTINFPWKTVQEIGTFWNKWRYWN